MRDNGTSALGYSRLGRARGTTFVVWSHGCGPLSLVIGSSPRLGFTILVTDQLPNLRRFYVEVIGLEILEERGDYIKLDAGSVFIAMRQANRHYDRPGSGGQVQLAFPVSRSEVESWERRLRDSGAEILEPPTDQAWGHRTLFAADPDGNLIEFYADIIDPRDNPQQIN